MSKRFIERNAEYKSHREELRMKEKRPYKTLVIRERERERDLYNVQYMYRGQGISSSKFESPLPYSITIHIDFVHYDP